MKRSNTVFFGGFRVSAAHMHKPSYEALKAHRFEDTAYFEPFYLKDFITSQPKKNILGK
jgi:tRNA threonylcarbamoyladenosine biosynthesis protein TsaB